MSSSIFDLSFIKKTLGYNEQKVGFISDPPVSADNTAYLHDILYENTIPFVPPIQYGKVIKVYDGDTFTIAAKLPNTDSPVYRFSVRLNGIDTPEIHGKTMHEKELAIAARDALHKLIYGKIINLQHVATEKYGRILADVYVDNIHVNDWLIQNKYAVPYDGGTKNRPNDWE